ncbi:hypothetical protein PHLGIDRAFT_115001 [Phlebiopsis gigantea 11061_1 CR5-6]|uniref:Uncharacterized protein n=1 Tax=Phlebiopsis gigantea (strain 11061_1 CR5-6) TaxID=745531 RepID=A0A0C3NZI7_PHLG1|nr:hypothetical protein PHLGIDRAFT_115001 [Phlebiopsis gigantea 11061_1 CR5-6]
MCNLETEGLQYSCGHYVITRKVNKIDCNSPYCTWSSRHRQPCNPCDHEKYLGPDAKETITGSVNDFCDQCRPYWLAKNADKTRRR